MKNSRSLRLGLSLAVTALFGISDAQSSEAVMQQGDNILGVGNVRSIEFLAINDFGEWLILTDTGNLDEDIDVALVRNGFLTLQEGNQLVLPDGATIDEFATATTINNAGLSAWAFEILRPPAPGGGNDPVPTGGIYFNTKLVLLSGEKMEVEGYHPNATWLTFSVGTVRFNDLNQMLIACDVLDPSIQGATDAALVLVDLDQTGTQVAIRDIAHKDGPVPGFPTRKVERVPSGYENLAINNLGDVMYQIKIDGPDATDRLIYINETLVARTGSPSGVDNLTWAALTNVSLDLNDRGDYAHLGSLSGPNNKRKCVLKNGETLIARERFPIEAIPNLRMDDFGISSPVHVPNTGDVIYYAEWTGPNATDTGICVNGEIVVREGITRVDGLLVDLLTKGSTLFDVSPNGRYLIYQCELETGRIAAAVVDLGRVEAVPDCGNNVGKLTRVRGFPLAGETITFGMDDGQGPGVTPFILLSDSLFDPERPCSQSLPFGDLLIAFGAGNPFLSLIGTPWGGEPVEIDLTIANNPVLINQIIYAQGIFFDVGDQVPAPAFSLTNAVEIEIGAP